jgi:hypothetical protein
MTMPRLRTTALPAVAAAGADRRPARLWAAAVVLGVSAGAAGAQAPAAPAEPRPLPPWPSAGAADLTRGAAQTAPVPSSGEMPGFGGSNPLLAPQAVVKLFNEGCIATEGDLQRTVDWAISAGLEPLDAATPNVQALLDGRAGSIFAAPGTQSRLMLAVGAGRHCVVWTEEASGPGVRRALLQVLGDRVARGDKVEDELDRKIERAGAWRQQSQWRYRRVGGSATYQLGAVTTLSDTPAAQVLRWAAPAPALGVAPDGTPIR